MKRIFTTLLLALPLWLAAQTTSITINTDRIIGEIDPNIYGVFMEPIGSSTEQPIRNTLYGTLYDPSSPLANADGFKTDYIEAMRELKITNMRWPGGNYVASYDWQDGIGPKETRPVRKDLAWGGYDPNHVGTDEWVQLNRAIGSENVICINLGLGDVNSARYWLEYCNVKNGTYFSDLRAKYGNPEPFNVKYWCLGNEVDGAPWINGYKNAEDYCKIGLEAAKALKNVDSTIRLVANGSSYYESTGIWLEWNRKVITAFTGIADYLSIHRYWHDGIAQDKRNDYYSYMGEAAMDFEEKITAAHAQVNIIKALYPEKKSLKLSVDEWAAMAFDIRGVLASAMCLNSFIRHADFVKMANYTMMTSLLGVNYATGATYKSPLFHAFKLFSNNCLGKSVDTYVQGDTFNAGRYVNIPYLDVTSVLSDDGKTVFINVINRHQDKAIATTIANAGTPFAGKAQVSTIAGALGEFFTPDKQNDYPPKTEEINVRNNNLTYTFPPHSLTQITIKIK
jgi:alpha-N-arabinofuranosidase